MNNERRTVLHVYLLIAIYEVSPHLLHNFTSLSFENLIEKMKVIFTHPQKVNILNLVEKYRDNRCYIFSSLDEMQQFMLE